MSKFALLCIDLSLIAEENPKPETDKRLDTRVGATAGVEKVPTRQTRVSAPQRA